MSGPVYRLTIDAEYAPPDVSISYADVLLEGRKIVFYSRGIPPDTEFRFLSLF